MIEVMRENSAYPAERRSGRDRRVRRFGNLIWMFKSGRRRQVRRASDQRRIHELDDYPKELFFLIILVLGLSVVDGILTLWLMDLGAREVNPVMAYYLKQGPQIFMAAKYLITAAVVLITVAMNHAVFLMLRVRTSHLLTAFAGCFAMVVAWELFLMAHRVA
jgi:hypothetical protein